MQAVVEAPTARNVEQVPAEQAVNRYLRQTLGEAYRAGKGRAMPNGNWRFPVLFHAAELKRPLTTAIVQVVGRSGRVIPLTQEQCQEAQERALIALAEAQKRLPVIGEYIPRVFAQRRANLYLSDNVGFFFTPINGTLTPAERPVWQFPIQFRLPQSGDLGVLDTIHVDAQTGEVLPLTPKQITEIQKHAGMLLLGVKHSRQRREADCLVACCAMVLDYLQVASSYDQLTRLLETQAFGSFFHRVHNLETLGLTVKTGKEAVFEVFEQLIEVGLPIIVAVRTWTLLHWQGVNTDHTLVVVGIDIDNERIYIHDPFFVQSPLELSFDEFDPAWTEMDRRYAVIGLTEVDN